MDKVHCYLACALLLLEFNHECTDAAFECIEIIYIGSNIAYATHNKQKIMNNLFSAINMSDVII